MRPHHLLLLTLAASCVPNSSTPNCDEGEAFNWDGSTLCMYRQPVLIEEGFSCPPEAGEFMPTEGGGICAPNDFGGDPQDAWEAWSEQQEEDDWQLEEEPSNNRGGESNVSDDETALDDNDTPDPGFVAVTEVLQQNCLLGGCHGDPPGAAAIYVVPEGQNATPADIARVLSNDQPTNSGNRLIEPGDPGRSEIYRRITKPPGDVELMGASMYGAAATPLPAAEISTIENWILTGAAYGER